ncbi:MAG: alpha/beta hydrolase [Anaerolineales bacterium]|jgi:proline iminopeptidase
MGNELRAGEHETILNGIRIHYTILGSGPPLIAISGGPGMDARGWDDFGGIDDFVTVIAIHPRGSGLSGDSPDEAYGLSDYAADVDALRRHLGLHRPIIAGWSHGGIVAQQVAISYPDDLSHLILIETSAYFGEFSDDVESAVAAFRDEPWYAASLEALKKEWAGEYETDEDMAALWAEEVKFYFAQFDERARAYHERTKDLPVRITPLKTFNENEAQTLDLRPSLGRVEVPTLIIVGRHDFITNVAMAEEIDRHLPNSQLAVFEDSGHFPLIEERQKFYQVIRDFVFA